MLHSRLIYQGLTLLADTVCASFVTLDTNPGWFTTLGADQHDIRDVKRSFKLHPARVNRATLSLDLFLVLGPNIHTLNDYPLLIWQDFKHVAALAFFLDLPADNFNGITFTEPVKQSS